MSSFVFPETALPLITNPRLMTIEELELDNFYKDTTTLGGNTYRIIRTNFQIIDEIALRKRQSLILRSQAQLLISNVYGPNFNINEVNIRAFTGLTHRQLLIIQEYLRENQ